MKEEALLIAINTPNPNGTKGIPVLLWGKPGVGKSSFIESLTSDKWMVLTIIASIYDPTDFSGLPMMDPETKQVLYASPSWVNSLEEKENSILFLDELSTCPPSVQAALLRVIFERKVGFKSLPGSTRIIAAANPPDLMVGGWELSPPMRNRFVHLEWDIDTKTYLNALSEGWEGGNIVEIDEKKHHELLPVWKDRVAAFLKVAPDALHGDPSKEDYGYASPRSWDYVIYLLASCDVLNKPLSLELVAGCVGEGTAISLIEYLENLNQPDPEEVLSGNIKPNISGLNDSELYILFQGMQRVISHTQDGQRFLSYSENLLSISEKVAVSGKRDVIFVCMQSLAKNGFLTRIISLAQTQTPDRYPQLMNQITSLFNEEGLVEFIDVLSE